MDHGLIGKRAVGAGDREVVGIAGFYAAYDLGRDVEGGSDIDQVLGIGRRQVDLQAVPHVEYLVHFLPVGAPC